MSRTYKKFMCSIFLLINILVLMYNMYKIINKILVLMHIEIILVLIYNKDSYRKQTHGGKNMKQNNKELGKAVQVILDTAVAKYCSNGCETEAEAREIVNLLNVAEDMTCFYDLWDKTESHAEEINSLFMEDDQKYRIIKEGFTYKLVTLA